MTNQEIIYKTSLQLVEQGLLTCDSNGIPEPIHTFKKWEELGYKVKKGEHSIIKFPIWKYTEKQETNKDTNEEITIPVTFAKIAYFFTFSQVEKIQK